MKTRRGKVRSIEDAGMEIKPRAQNDSDVGEDEKVRRGKKDYGENGDDPIDRVLDAYIHTRAPLSVG